MVCEIEVLKKNILILKQNEMLFVNSKKLEWKNWIFNDLKFVF